MRLGLGPMPAELRDRVAAQARAGGLTPEPFASGASDVPSLLLIYEPSDSCAAIRATREVYPERPPVIVALLEDADPEMIERILKAGASDYVSVRWPDEHIRLRLRIGRNRAQEAVALDQSVSALERSERHHRQLIEYCPNGIGIYAKDRFVYANQALASLLEVDTRDSVLGRQLCDFMEEADRARAAEQLQAFSSGRTGELPFERFQIRGAQGRESIVEVGGVPMQYEGERALAVLVYDVTASERSRAAIEAERAKLRTLIDAMPFSMTILDHEYRVDTQNLVSRERWGDLGGVHALAIDIPRDLRRVAQAQLDRALQGEHVDEYLNATVKGSRFVSRMILAPVKDDSGIPWIVGASLDVTEQRILEEAIRHIAEQAADAGGETIFRAMAHHLTEALGVRYASVARQEAPDALNLRTLGLVGGGQFMRAMEYEIAASPCEIVLSDGVAIYEDRLAERFPDDPMIEELGLESYGGVALRDSSGNAVGVINVFDTKPLAFPELTRNMLEIFARRAASELVHARAEAQRELLAAKLQQAQKLESLGLLAGGIAHDFNNLLTSMLAPASMARARVEPESLLDRLLETIESSASSAAELTQQILAYSGRGRFVVETVDAARVVDEVTALLAAGLPKRVALERTPTAEPLPVEVDVAQLRQVVLNLGTNAGDAIGDDDGRVMIRTLHMQPTQSDLDLGIVQPPPPPGDYVCIEVSDTGCGIKRGHIQRIFDPFFSTKTQGRGLGLAAVIGIVRGHGGTLLVSSREGEGTTMRLLLPLAVAERPGETIPAGTVPWRASGCVLLVDDESAVRLTAGTILEEAGLDVVYAIDGVEAVDLFRQERHRIDCVLLDLTMPRMGGQEAMRLILEIDPMARIVLSSGYTAQDTVERCGIRGHLGFLQKPYREPDLLAAIRMAMSASHPEDAEAIQ